MKIPVFCQFLGASPRAIKVPSRPQSARRVVLICNLWFSSNFPAFSGSDLKVHRVVEAKEMEVASQRLTIRLKFLSAGQSCLSYKGLMTRQQHHSRQSQIAQPSCNQNCSPRHGVCSMFFFTPLSIIQWFFIHCWNNLTVSKACLSGASDSSCRAWFVRASGRYLKNSRSLAGYLQLCSTASWQCFTCFAHLVHLFQKRKQKFHFNWKVLQNQVLTLPSHVDNCDQGGEWFHIGSTRDTAWNLGTQLWMSGENCCWRWLAHAVTCLCGKVFRCQQLTNEIFSPMAADKELSSWGLERIVLVERGPWHPS